MHDTGVAHLVLRVSDVVHCRRRSSCHRCHARMRKGQHDEQRKHEAKAKQQTADIKDVVITRHESELGREQSQIKSRLGVRPFGIMKVDAVQRMIGCQPSAAPTDGHAAYWDSLHRGRDAP